MKRTLFSIAAILCASLVFVSCTKEYNTINDAQALTSVFEIRTSDWKPSDLGFTTSFYMDEITPEITDQGAVWIYFSFDNGNSYELAPSLSRSDANGNIFDFLAESGTDPDNSGFIFLSALTYTGNTDVAPTYSNPPLVVKVVSIPSSVYMAHKNVNKENYNEVKRVFNLR